MEMQNVLTSLRDLCQSPAAWAIFGAVALRAVWSAVAYFRCPLMRAPREMDPNEAHATVNARFRHSPRFLMAMLVGLMLSIGGLYALTLPSAGPVALAAIVFGVFILIVEPSRLSVEDNELRVNAARRQGPDAMAFAQERLRAAHVERIAIEIGLTALLLAALLML
jgi:uncharacterized membrane protein